MTTIFLDLDGTLVDVSERLYHVYHDLLIESAHKPMNRTAYSQLKRHGVKDADIARLSGYDRPIQSYLRRRRNRIESPAYLQYDHLFRGVKESLRELSLKHRLVLVTLRQSKESTLTQLDRFSVLAYFAACLVSDHRSNRETNWQTKVRLIKDYWTNHASELGFVVGDSEVDILTGIALGFSTIAISYGLRSPEVLQTYAPDYVIGSIVELSDCINHSPAYSTSTK